MTHAAEPKTCDDQMSLGVMCGDLGCQLPATGGGPVLLPVMVVKLGDLDLTQGFVPISQECLADFAPMDWSGIERMMRWAMMGSDPWPQAGFNPHLRTFPEPEPDYCEECGRPFDEDECC